MTAITATAARTGRPATCSPASPPGRAWLSDSIDLGAYPEAVPVARSRTRQLLHEWGLPDLADDAESIVAELVTNAVQATHRAQLDTPVRLTLIAGLRTLLITAWDAAAEQPAPSTAAPYGEHGRGLLLVAALSACWDWKQAPRGGKTIRALLRGAPAGPCAAAPAPMVGGAGRPGPLPSSQPQEGTP